MLWLSIHILLPLMLLAALMIERVIEACVDLSWNVREQGLRALALRPAGQIQLASDSDSSGEAQVKMLSESAEDSEVSAVSEPVARDPWTPPAFIKVVQRGYRAVAWRSVGTIVTAALALALFIPMVHSMVELA